MCARLSNREGSGFGVSTRDAVSCPCQPLQLDSSAGAATELISLRAEGRKEQKSRHST